jgi:hypothetical protein
MALRSLGQQSGSGDLCVEGKRFTALGILVHCRLQFLRIYLEQLPAPDINPHRRYFEMSSGSFISSE